MVAVCRNVPLATGVVNSTLSETFQLKGDTRRKLNFGRVTIRVHGSAVAFDELGYHGNNIQILMIFRVKWARQNLAEQIDASLNEIG